MSRGQLRPTGHRVSMAFAMACLAMPACASGTDDSTNDTIDDSNIEHSDIAGDAIQTTDSALDTELALDLNVDLSLRIGNGTDVDWSVAIVESTMKRFTPSQLGGWGYTQGLYLWGQYLVYQRTREARYLNYIKSWADRFVDSSGHINHSFNNLDSMESGNVLLALYAETKQGKYKTAATQIRNRLKTYPRTQDGGFWHATATSRQHQLWSDGVFMVNPFLARYGKAIGEATYANDEVSKQLLVYANHLQVQNGLLKHAYDESRTQSWADPETGRSAEHWCRAIGWYGMATIDVLELLPQTHPSRTKLLSVLEKLVAGYKTYQDPATGRWFQVVDKGNLSDNWTETSCSAMYTYTISRAVERGYIDPSYRTVSAKGYQGVLARISNGSDGLTNVSEICIGTNVGDLAFYFARPRKTNDLHGLGAVLIMNEQLARTGG